jgi:hypothetical protein
MVDGDCCEKCDKFRWYDPHYENVKFDKKRLKRFLKENPNLAGTEFMYEDGTSAIKSYIKILNKKGMSCWTTSLEMEGGVTVTPGTAEEADAQSKCLIGLDLKEEGYNLKHYSSSYAIMYAILKEILDTGKYKMKRRGKGMFGGCPF